MSRIHDAAGDKPDMPFKPESEKQIPLMGGLMRPEGLPEAEEGDFGSAKPESRLLNQGTLLIVMVAAIAAGAIYIMRVSQGDIANASEDTVKVEARIEQALAKLSKPGAMAGTDPLQPGNMKALFEDTDAILGMFSDDHAKRQVPVEFLKKDPFELVVAKPQAAAAAAAQPVNDRQSDELNRKIAAAAKELKLQSIMGSGANAIAVVNGELLQVGQTTGEFKVIAITGREVQLESNGRTVTINMDVDTAGPAGRNRR